jgi:triacylglycerol lipase
MTKLESIAREIGKLGAQFNPDVLAATRALYLDLIPPANKSVAVERDIAYGKDLRQKLDIYSRGKGTGKPVLLYVPGGGFTGGDKRIDETFYRNVAEWFAARDFIVVTMNYRLAPGWAWPAGAEDVREVLHWIEGNASRYCGDPRRVLVFGQSAGATHVATALFDPQFATRSSGIRGIVLASGFYRMTESHWAPNLAAYFGADPLQYEARSPLAHVATAPALPVLLTVAEFDPAFLSAPTFLLAEALTRRNGRPPEVCWLRGHNHVSTVLSFGSGDDMLGENIITFARNTLG